LVETKKQLLEPTTQLIALAPNLSIKSSQNIPLKHTTLKSLTLQRSKFWRISNKSEQTMKIML